MQESQNHGKGFAVRKGLLAATRPMALFSDADLSTPIEEAPKLLEPIAAGELDVAFGSRALNRRLIGNRQAWHREQGGRAFNLLVRLATGLPYLGHAMRFQGVPSRCLSSDPHAGADDGFSFDVELLYLARKAGLRMREIPVRWDHNEGAKFVSCTTACACCATSWRCGSTEAPDERQRCLVLRDAADVQEREADLQRDQSIRFRVKAPGDPKDVAEQKKPKAPLPASFSLGSDQPGREQRHDHRRPLHVVDPFHRVTKRSVAPLRLHEAA